MRTTSYDWHIVVLTMNALEFLRECLQSVQAARSSFEGTVAVTCVQDGPPDNKLAAVLRACRTTTSFELITSDTRRGISASRNSAIGRLHSEFVLCLDGDDKISSDYLTSSMVPFSAGADVVFTWRQKIKSTGEVISEGPVRPRCIRLEQLSDGNHIHAASPFRRNLWERVRGYDETMEYWEDYEFWIRCLKSAASVEPSASDACVFHRMHDASRTRLLINSDPGNFRRKLQQEIAARHKEWDHWK